jgi:hypothetical protein
MLESGQILAARYSLLRKLGEGETTQVWHARDLATSSDRVLKILVRDGVDSRRRFLAVARLQQSVDHPNVQACEAVDDGVPAFAVFADVAATDSSVLRGRSSTDLLPVLAGVADGLAALHGRGIVHRDLKPGNVLLRGDGTPQLADFGLAAVVGDAVQPAAGSPFSASPQQLQGAPAATTDDVYGFGALAYELLCGYPPFYPDASSGRTSGTAPAPFASRLAVPPELERLVLQCLEKRPEDRPESCAGIASALRGMKPAPAAAPAAPATVAVELQPPPMAGGPIAPEWRRASASGPSPEQLRSQGFRRGLVAGALAFLLIAAGFVFLVLPRWVGQSTSPPTAVTAPPPSASPPSPAAEPDLRQLAEAKRAYEELRPEVAKRLEALEGRAAATWGGETFMKGKDGFTAAEAAFGERDYPRALVQLQTADQDLTAVEMHASEALRAALAAGAAALESGAAKTAQEQFALALKIDPDNATARRGLERAGTLDEVRRLLADATAAERDGQSAAALAAYRKALGLDRDSAAAREGIARLQSQATQAAFSSAMAQGLAALTHRDYAAARAAFERAGNLRPGAPEVADGLAQVERGLGDRAIDGFLQDARRAEGEERWADAVADYRKALDVDRNLLPARQGLERAEPRAMLDAELAAYLERPERLSSSEVRGAARAALRRAQSVADPGPLLRQQVASVARLVDAAETPVRVALASDNLTEVTIYRVGRLGTFDHKDMELLPGRYTVVGVRAGYRDVRRELEVQPGRGVPTLDIRCEEPI